MNFQKYLSDCLNSILIENNISKKQFSKLICTSAVFVTKITSNTGKLPSARKLRKIITELEEIDLSAEYRIESIVTKYADEDYTISYFVEKLRETHSNSSSFISFLQKESINSKRLH